MENTPNPYGAPQSPPPPQQSPYDQQMQPPGYSPYAKTSGLAIASLVCGIIGIFLFQYILGPLAVIFGHVSLSSIKRSPQLFKGRGLAIGGLVCGYIAIAIFILAIIFFASVISNMR